MRRRILALTIILSLSVPAAVTAQNIPDPRTLSFPPLKFEIPKAERVVLESGMVVYLMEDHELPQVSITACVGAGSIYEPATKTGLAGLTGAVMRSGGTVSLSRKR